MEAEESMELRDLPVDTRNYTIIDNITGKPIEQSNYSLTIDPTVIGKLNELKRVNEEKIKQASLKSQYSEDMLVDTYTPEDNSVFTPVYEGEYINAQDYNLTNFAPVEEKVEEEVKVEEKEETFAPTEVLQSDTLLDRVVARDPISIPQEEVNTEENTSVDNPEGNIDQPMAENQEGKPMDNSTFQPGMTGLQQASEQIVKIDADKLGPAIKPPKHHDKIKKKKHKIDLDKMEVRESKSYAWLAYILFFLPLLINKKNRFVRLHANEGLDLNILEILGVALLLPYFLVSATGTLASVLFVCSLLGIVIIGMCALTILPMIISAMCGLQFQIPWLWKKRLIKVAETRE